MNLASAGPLRAIDFRPSGPILGRTGEYGRGSSRTLSIAGFREGLAAATENVDGGELYHLRSPSEFAGSYFWRKYKFPTVACFVPKQYARDWAARTSISFGIYDCRFTDDCVFGGDPLPELTSTLENALARSDRWVWFYTEAHNFLLPPNAGGASQAWIDAVRDALQ